MCVEKVEVKVLSARWLDDATVVRRLRCADADRISQGDQRTTLVLSKNNNNLTSPCFGGLLVEIAKRMASSEKDEAPPY